MSETLVPLEFVHHRLRMDVAFAEVRKLASLVAVVAEDARGVGGNDVECDAVGIGAFFFFSF